MQEIIRNNKYFLIPYSIILIASLLVLLLFSKAGIHLFLNSFHSHAADTFFASITYLGAGLSFLVAVLIFLFINYRQAIILAVGGSVSGLLAQFLKRLVFSDLERPRLYFENIADIRYVPGIDVYSNYSFPSGHATSAFCLFFILSHFSRNKYLKILSLLMAMLVGYSRIYLSQHFLEDVVAGSVCGMLTALASLALIAKPGSGALDKSLLSLLKKS